MSISIEPDAATQSAVRHNLAVQFIDAHSAEHLHDDQLLARCVQHLQRLNPFSTRAAVENVALHALAEVRSRAVPAYFDMSHSTSLVLRVVDPQDGSTYAFNASELLEMARSNAKESPTAQRRAVRLCGRRTDVPIAT